MRKIAFQKWEATGNDFLFIDSLAQGVEAADIPASAVVNICNRETGQGADGVVLYAAPAPQEVGKMTVINSDGSLGGMCGNALRCLAKILFAETGIAVNNVELAGRTVELDGGVPSSPKVVMGAPESIPGSKFLDSPAEFAEIVGQEGFLVSFGNPHLVVPVERIPDDWINLGQRVQEPAHQLLGTGGINCGFLEREPGERDVRRLRVFERGAGPTQACGSGACAASTVLEKILHAGSSHRLELPGGLLQIGREQNSHTLKGPANKLYEGIWSIDS